MARVYRMLRVAPSDEGVLGVVIDAPPMNLIGPELVRDLVGLLAALESGRETKVVVLESADPDYFVPHVGCWGQAGPWRRFWARTTSPPNWPSGTAGSTGTGPTPNWTN